MEPLEPRLEIWRGMLRGQRAMMLRLVARLKRDFNLTTPQYEALLSLVEAGGPLTAAELSDVLLYSSGSTTNLIARLEERGLVRRDRDTGDGRVVHISLTEAGQHLIEAATEAHVADIRASFTPLIHDDEMDAVLAFTRRLSTAESVISQPF